MNYRRPYRALGFIKAQAGCVVQISVDSAKDGNLNPVLENMRGQAPNNSFFSFTHSSLPVSLGTHLVKRCRAGKESGQLNGRLGMADGNEISGLGGTA